MNGNNYQAADFNVFFFKAVTGCMFLLSRVTYSNFYLIKTADWRYHFFHIVGHIFHTLSPSNIYTY